MTSLDPTRIGPASFAWGTRTFVMGILNVTPDSFSGDGLLAGSDHGASPIDAAVAQARRMVAEGADILDIGGESTRPGHAPVEADEERDRVVPVIAAVRAAVPSTPISVDTTKPSVAEAALAAGADLVNDVWGVGDDDALVRVAAAHGVPLVVMHNRREPVYADLVAEVVDDLAAALDRARRLGVPRRASSSTRGSGSARRAEQNLAILRELGALRVLGRPILLGTSRKSTLGKVLDLPADERLEATLATTAIGIAFGADIVRVHDVVANVRAARMSDAIVRGSPWDDRPHRPARTCASRPRMGSTTGSARQPQPFEVDVELALDLRPAGATDDLARTVDYGRVYDVVADVLLTRTFRLLEAIAEAIATDLLASEPAVDAVVVRVRKPAVVLGGPLDHAAVEIERRRDAQAAG